MCTFHAINVCRVETNVLYRWTYYDRCIESLYDMIEIEMSSIYTKNLEIRMVHTDVIPF